MFNMTVHTDQSRFPQDKERGHGPMLVNGHRKIEGPLLENLTLCKSWNGCTWQLQRAPESRESPRIPNGEIGLSQTLPIPAKSRDTTSIYANIRRDSPSTRSQSRESPVSLGSGTSSDKNRIARSYDDDSVTTASSNFDSTDQEEEYVTLDRSYIFPRSFRVPTHHTSMIDLQHNSLYSPKVSNEELANQNGRTVPNKHSKFRPPFTRSVSVNGKVHIHETDLDSVDEKGRPISWTKRSLKKIYENINDTLKPKLTSPTSPKTDNFDPVFLNDDKISIHSEYVGIKQDTSNATHQEQPDSGIQRQRKRSKSLGELQLFGEKHENELDSDEDGDDFGFKSFPFDRSLAAMHKAKGSSSHHRILPKRWRSKPRSSAASCLWSPEGNCSWCNVSGRKLVLRPISILQLSEAERLVLQKIALQKLQSLDLGCPVVIPKERHESGRRKRHMLSFKRSKSANLSGLIHGMGEREKADKEIQPTGMVFGIPLSKCVANDQEIQRRRSADPLRERKEPDVIIHRQGPRKSSSSSQGSEENYTQNGNNMSNESQKRTASSDSLSESESSRNTSSSLIDALSLSTARQESLKQDYLPNYATGAPQVPQIVKLCFQHIETYGLRVLGIFRVGASKKRTNQLRDEFDSGKDVKLNDTHNPHEVGALLKEYFRDLPEPLLTRDLYSPLVATRELTQEDDQLSATRLLISLLPVPNRDTLWALLEFLSKVNQHSTDALDESGQTLPGNKMDTHNLATLFGPNILHKAKSTEKEFTVESMARAEERKEVIDVVKSIITNHHELFKIPASLHDEILRLLLETDPETTEQILKRVSNDPCIEPDPDTTTSSLYEDSDASLPHSPTKRHESGRRKRHMLSFKRSKSANLSGLIHGMGEREKTDKEIQPTGMVFGIPLSKCVANDQEIQRRRSADPLRERKESDVIIHRQGPRKSSSSSQGSEENYTQNGNNMSNESQKRTASSDSLSESESSRNTSSSLIDALSLSTARQESLKQDYLPNYATGAPQVPQIVKLCFQHIETYGLRVLGIFRVGASKKRTNQLRDEFDSGKDVKLNDTHNPHEVGALLKEYFRDLPEPLLTRDLYSPLVATRELTQEDDQLSATRLLISLLSVPNRDTLWALLEFLSKVNQHSTDALDESGQTLPGNKMDTHNLATLFGPNILHKAKSTEKEFTVESMARAEERKEVIDVVKSIITNHHALFQIPASLHDEILRLLLETDPETTEQILKRVSNDPCIEPDPDTTTSSLYEDSDASLPHSPTSESNISFKNTPVMSHPPLRVAKSAEMLTPCSRRRFFFSPLNDAESAKNSKNREHVRKDSQERPKFHLVIDGEEGPPVGQRTPRNTRSQKTKLHRDSSDPDFSQRPHSVHVERPHSELYTSAPQNLAIPSPNYMRQYNSPVLDSQSNTSLHNPVRSDSFGHSGIPRSPSSSGLTRAGSSSPRITSSAQRPLDIRRTERPTSSGANDVQSDGWRQWKNLASDKSNEGFEQETLV